MKWICPVCGRSAEFSEGSAHYISCVVRCKTCDSSIGLSLMSGGVSVVYTRVPQVQWIKQPKREEEKRLLQEATEQGWTVIETKKGVMLLAPDGVGKVVMHGTNSDRRALRNLVSIMKRHGFQAAA